MEAYLEAGRIVNTHGVRGDVKAESYCDSPRVLAGLKRVYLKKGETYIPRAVRHGAVFREFVILHLEDCETMDDAAALKWRKLYARREDIPLAEGAFFVADLIGLPVYRASDTRRLGTLTDYIERGAQPIYEVDTGKEKVLVPAVPAFLDHADPADGIYLNPIDGMFEEET